MTRLGIAAASSLSVLCVSYGCGGRRVLAPSTPDNGLDREPVCKGTKVRSDPFVVEWPSASRARLESLRRAGPILVRMEGCNIEPISGCSVNGAYRYSPITKKRESVAIRNADELHGSVPLGAVSLEGKLATAGQLTVSLTLVGRFESDKTSFRPDELAGACERATHVVSALSIGAFRFFTGAESEVGGSAAAFGASAGGKSMSRRELLAEDGRQDACDAAKGVDREPPADCGAVVRIEVTPVGAGAPARVETHECAENDVKDCRTQCDLGNGKSCVRLGQWQHAAEMSSLASRTKAIPHYKRACDLGEQTGCALLGLRYVEGDGVGYDPIVGLKLLKSACAAQNPTACTNLNTIYFREKKAAPDEEGIDVLKQFCALGLNAVICGDLKAAGHLP